MDLCIIVCLHIHTFSKLYSFGMISLHLETITDQCYEMDVRLRTSTTYSKSFFSFFLLKEFFLAVALNKQALEPRILEHIVNHSRQFSGI